MNKTKAAGDTTAGRAIEEIAFHANILALHDAIQAATGGEGMNADSEVGGASRLDAELSSLVDRIRRPDPRGL